MLLVCSLSFWEQNQQKGRVVPIHPSLRGPGSHLLGADGQQLVLVQVKHVHLAVVCRGGEHRGGVRSPSNVPNLRRGMSTNQHSRKGRGGGKQKGTPSGERFSWCRPQSYPTVSFPPPESLPHLTGQAPDSSTQINPSTQSYRVLEVERHDRGAGVLRIPQLDRPVRGS